MTRRHVLGSAAAAAIPLRATAVNFRLPAHSCDCHTHIFGDPAKFPFAAKRGYTPPPAEPAEMSAFHKSLGIERVVVVTPSVYGTDNSASIHGMKARGKTARGVAVIDEKTSDRQLRAMDQAGMRGIRLNFTNAGINDPAVARARFVNAAQRMKQMGWHIQMLTSPAVIHALRDTVMDSPVLVVFDHFGGAAAAKGVEQPGFADLVALVKSGRAYVKISGAYRASTLAPDYRDAAPLARALIQANPDRVVWGTDWPHPDSGSGRRFDQVSAPVPVDDGLVLNQLPLWAPDAAVRKKILADNPARLYGF
jgi:predicted TIM-barrel fold metal-dependent hydrolase